MLSRRAFIEAAVSIGASVAWAGRPAQARQKWTERRDVYPEGVASGDPNAVSVLLWTRRAPLAGFPADRLTVEVAEDPEFRRVVAVSETPALAESDWTCRVLVGGLKAAHI